MESSNLLIDPSRLTSIMNCALERIAGAADVCGVISFTVMERVSNLLTSTADALGEQPANNAPSKITSIRPLNPGAKNH